MKSIFTLAALGAISVGSLCSATFSFTSIDDPSETQTITFAQGITDGGTIVGYYNSTKQAYQVASPYAVGNYSNVVTPSPINGLTVTQNALIGINDSGGESVGYFVSTTGGTKSYAMTDIGGTISQLVMPSGLSATNSFANAVNASGTVVGIYIAGGATHGFMAPNNTVQNIKYDCVLGGITGANTNFYAINDSGIAAGYCNVNGAIHGFTYNGTTWTQVDAPASLIAGSGTTILTTNLFGLDNAGDMAGQYITAAPINGVTNFGWYYNAASNTFQTILFPQGNAFNQGAGIQSTEVLGLNNQGQIVGMYQQTDGGTNHGFVGTIQPIVVGTTPEPGTMLLTSIAFGGIFAIVRKRRAARS